MKYIILLCLFLISCTKTPNDYSPQFYNELDKGCSYIAIELSPTSSESELVFYPVDNKYVCQIKIKGKMYLYPEETIEPIYLFILHKDEIEKNEQFSLSKTKN